MYLLMKRGLYWRPNSQGYTGIKAEAGRYTEQEAKEWADHDRTDTTAIHEDDAPDFSQGCCPYVKADVLEKENAKLRAEIEWLRN